MNKADDFIVVGIGASAGGVKVLKDLVQTLPSNPGYTIVIVQHLAPDHESLMPELLRKVTSLPVSQAKTGELVECDHVYLIPPNTEVGLAESRFHLTPRESGRKKVETIDHFFRALAHDKKEKSVGIILSGAGSDGTAGLRAIKASGGLAIVQDPETAVYSSMPLSAIQTEIVDAVLPIKKMSEVLQSFSRTDSNSIDKKAQEATEHIDEDDLRDHLNELTAILEHREGFDLRKYKPGTVLRRLSRRMGLLNIASFESYMETLRVDEAERKRLVKDLLIKVTDFFRDAQAFNFVEKNVIAHLTEHVGEHEEIRVWIPGCATGEEAYSFAMLFLQHLEKQNKLHPLKIFATDIDEEAIHIARRGIYPSSVIQEVPHAYLEKYFLKTNQHHYKVTQRLRDCISFARHNLTSDPPFPKTDLISCRNVLIYLRRAVQIDILSSFHFSLIDGGHLFLGSSENIGKSEHLFKTLSKKWRLYQKKLNPQAANPPFESPVTSTKKLSLDQKITASVGEVQPTRAEIIQRTLLKSCLAPTVILDSDDRAIFIHGKLDPFLNLPEGEPTFDFYSLVPLEIRSRIRSTCFKVRKTLKPATISCTLSKKDSSVESVLVSVKPIEDKEHFESGCLIISFSEHQSRNISSLPQNLDESKSLILAEELAETKEELKNTIEELETNSEELKASHEEAVSTNEELQSANEELEASAEELRSLNEELSTTNEQLKQKIMDLRQARDDIHNFFASADVATIFIDENLAVKRFTPAAADLLKLSTNEHGRRLSTLPSPLIDAQMVEDTQKVLNNFKPIERDIDFVKGKSFQIRLTPYRTEDRRVEGVVILFQEVTQLRNLSLQAQQRAQQQAVIAQLGYDALFDNKIETLMQKVVRQVAHVLDVEYCKILKYQPQEKKLLLVSGTGWQPGLVGKATVPDDFNSQAGYTLEQKEPVVVKNLKTEKRFEGPDLLLNHNVVSGVSCVINHSTPPYGVLGIHTTHQRDFTPDEVNFIKSVCNLLSIALKTKEANQRLAQSEARLQVAKQSNRMGIHEWEMATNHLYWDDLLKEIWGVRENETITFDTFLQGLHPEDVEPTLKAIEKAKDPHGEGHYFAEYRVINKLTKETFWIEATGAMFFENGVPTRLIGMVIDVTGHKETAIGLENAIEKMRKISENKNTFLSMLGHELRNPLGVISGCLEELQGGPPEDGPMLEMARRNLSSMTRLLDDLLDISRISQNKLRLTRFPVQLDIILEQQIQSIAQRIKSHPDKFDCRIEPNLTVLGDQVRLEQLFSNVLNNAVKYSPEESPIFIEAKNENSQVIVTISDKGVGIESHLLEKIFEPFMQADNVGTVAYSGLGIGLALAKNLVELHGGTIKAVSPGKGEGASFVIALPYHSPTEDLDKDWDPHEWTSFKDVRVVVVEDNPDLAETTSRMLKRRGCLVEVYHEGKAGLEASNSHPNIMLIDLQLPDLSGYDIAKSIVERGNKSTTLVALSGFGHQSARNQAFESGFDYHLSKPIDLKQLAHIFSNLKKQKN